MPGCGSAFSAAGEGIGAVKVVGPLATPLATQHGDVSPAARVLIILLATCLV